MAKHHNLSNTLLSVIWRAIKQKCYNPNCKDYKYYGARGIAICDEWRNDFKAFYDWAMASGYKKEKLPNGLNKWTIDRINNNGNYEPSNCRWITSEEQQQNRRNNKPSHFIQDYCGKFAVSKLKILSDYMKVKNNQEYYQFLLESVR